MYIMTAKAVFLQWVDDNGQALTVRRVAGIQISKSWKQRTQTATLLLPKNIGTFVNQNIKELFRRGDRVQLYLGYDGNDILEYEGYITRIGSKAPIEIQLEDEMSKAKRIAVNYVGKNIKLGDMLRKLAPGYEVKALDTMIGDARFSKTNLGAVLEKLESELKLYSYFKGKTLYCGIYYAGNGETDKQSFVLERNVVGNDLNYRNKEDIVVKIEATSIQADGSKLEYSKGDEGGDVLTLAYYNVSSKKVLEQKVEKDYELAMTGGFEGSFTAFGLPSVQFGQRVQLQSKLITDSNGEYYIESVEKSFNGSGFRQKVQLGGLAKLEGHG